MPEYSPNIKSMSDSEQITALDYQVSKIEEELDIPSNDNLSEKGKVASSFLEKTNLNNDASFGYADENNDGIKDTIVVDSNLDGKINKIFLDTNNDGEFDTIMIDTDDDGVLDIQISDTDGNGLTKSDASEVIHYEIMMNEYQSLENTDDSINQLDALDSIF